MMKTTLHLHRHAATARGAASPQRATSARRRCASGSSLSLVAAVLAIVLSRPSCTCRPCVILIPVVIVGFALSGTPAAVRTQMAGGRVTT